MSRYYRSFLEESGTVYPASLKLFIDAGNPLSYSGSGTTVTDLIGTQNGTLTNGVGYSTTNGGYFTFNGTNQYVTFGINTTIQPITSRTVSMWVYFNPASTFGSFYSDGNLFTDRNGVNIWYDNSGYRTEIASSSSFQLGVNGGTSKGVWYYITSTFNGTSLKLYRNATLNSTTAQTVTPSNGIYPTLLGNCNGGNQFLNGNISQLKIYNTSLSDAEILTDFNEFKSRYGY